MNYETDIVSIVSKLQANHELKTAQSINEIVIHYLSHVHGNCSILNKWFPKFESISEYKSSIQANILFPLSNDCPLYLKIKL